MYPRAPNSRCPWRNSNFCLLSSPANCKHDWFLLTLFTDQDIHIQNKDHFHFITFLHRNKDHHQVLCTPAYIFRKTRTSSSGNHPTPVPPPGQCCWEAVCGRGSRCRQSPAAPRGRRSRRPGCCTNQWCCRRLQIWTKSDSSLGIFRNIYLKYVVKHKSAKLSCCML